MSIFYIIALICANIYQSKVAVLHLEHANHVTHVQHVHYVNYLAFIKRQESTRPILLAPIAQPIATPSTSPVHTSAPVAPAPVQTYSAPPGDYSCSSLESLWVSQGGNPGSEFIAAQIATAESGGNPSAISPTSDYGLWQINSSNAPGSEMLNPIANVREAIALSGNGSNWSPWTTYTSGIYASEC